MEYLDSLTLIDLIVTPVFLIVFYFIANSIRFSHIERNSSYRFFVTGLMVKMIGALGVCLVYIYYYKGGDTLVYYHDSIVMSNLFFRSPFEAIRLTFFSPNSQSFFVFDNMTDWPLFLGDPHAFAVVRICWILSLISFKSYLGQSMLLSLICYSAVWRLYQMLIYEFPTLQRQMAIAVLFIPSVVFWGSGLLKDTITFASVCMITSSLHQIIRLNKGITKNMVYIFFTSYILIMIKPYIFFALMPGSALWFGGIVTADIKNKLLKKALTPIFIIVSAGAAYMMLLSIGSSLGDYRVDNVLAKAAITQQDLKQDYYGGSTFDIGDFDPSVRGILGKSPAAINAALFRPYLWEAHNPAMIMSGFENMILLILTLYFLWKLRFFNLFRLMFRHHFLFFSITFSIFFAFSVGLTTSNFGSLVRYKIPAIPFYVASLFIIANSYSEMKRKEFAPKEINEDDKNIALLNV